MGNSKITNSTSTKRNLHNTKKNIRLSDLFWQMKEYSKSTQLLWYELDWLEASSQISK